jgi:hypothetical protein
MRLRRTEFPTMRAAIANPRRGTAAPVFRANIAKHASAERRASRYTRSNSDFCRRRCAGLNGRAGDKEIVAESAAQLIARSGSHRETLATFRAAPGENQTTRSRGHAGAKAVRALTMQIARLVRTLHGGISRGKFFSKVPLKQAHGGAERRAARVRSTSLSVKRVAAFRRRSGVRNFARPGCG